MIPDEAVRAVAFAIEQAAIDFDGVAVTDPAFPRNPHPRDIALARAALAAAAPHMPARPTRDVETIIRDIAELPDRTSPEDQPEMMLVTADELRALLPAPEGWRPIETCGPWDGQPYRQWVRLEGSRDHHGARWARIYAGEAFVRPPGADDEMLGYRRQDILRLCEHGDIDAETARVTHWMPVSFPPLPAIIADHCAEGEER